MKTVITFLNCCLLVGCNAQGFDPDEETSLDSLSGSAPQTKVKVEKEYDEHGNLLRYDSSYSWSYSNIDTAIAGQPFKWDSLFPQWGRGSMFDNSFFSTPFSQSTDSTDSDLPGRNSTNPLQQFWNSPFHRGGFQSPFDNDWNKQMEEMMRRQRDMMRQFRMDDSLFWDMPAPMDNKDDEDDNKI